MSAEAKLQYARDYQNRIPFVAHLGLVTDELGAGTARLSMPLPRHFTNSLGTAHGGVIMSLLDVALCTAARTLHPES
ncbi:MAG: PaaI family thioesterase, partial [Burkholderiales bacterium]